MKYKGFVLIPALFILSVPVYGQNTFTGIVQDSITSEKLVGVNVALKNTALGNVTGNDGAFEIREIPDGDQTFIFSYVGYLSKQVTIHFPVNIPGPLLILMQIDETNLDEVVISTTRTNSRVEDTPVKIEVLGLEEMDEESSFVPGSIASILGDVSSVQVQQISPVTGNSIVRMQGLDGRYTLLLRDGIPSIGGLSGGLDILQIPPLDLQQIEIVKGPASTLNGGGAIAGLINFISKKPADPFEAAFLLNQTSLKETNLDAYVSGTHNKTAFTFLGASTAHQPVDVDKDGYSDAPLLHSILLHPQLFYDFNKNNTMRIGLISSFENRTGGDMEAIRENYGPGHQYYIKNKTSQIGAEIFYNNYSKRRNELSFRSSVNRINRSENTNISDFKGTQAKVYSELYYSIPFKDQDILFGANYLLDDFRKLSNDSLPVKDLNFQTQGFFAQYSLNKEKKINLQAGIRADHANDIGWFVLPSFAALFHAGDHFSFRINGGTGYKIPNLLEFSESALTNAEQDIDMEPNVTPERSAGGTIEWNYNKIVGKDISIFFNQTFFLTRISHAVIPVLKSNGNLSYMNTGGILTSRGIDNYIQVNISSYEFYVGYTFTLPVNSADTLVPYLSYTPLHRGALTLVHDFTGHLTAGVEASYNGPQYRDDGSKTRDYLFVAASIKVITGQFTFVLNGENILDFRQTKYERVITGPADSPVFSKLWAPVEGRVLNISVMWRL